MSLAVQFSGKAETIFNVDGSPAFQRIKVPALARRHCDMSAFRVSRKYGSYANSDLFPSLLNRAVRSLGIGDYIRLDNIPAGVSIDSSGFLSRVTIHLSE